MNEMVERVAEAIALSGNGGTWNDWYNENQREFHRKRARAAIAAMRDHLETLAVSGSSAYDSAIKVLDEALNPTEK
jgi:hypothetical protein